MSFVLYGKWHERLTLVSVAVANALAPLEVAVRINYWFAKYMARNPAHAFAKNMVMMIESRKANER